MLRTSLLALTLLVPTLAAGDQDSCQQQRLDLPTDLSQLDSFGDTVATNGQWVFVGQSDLDVGGETVVGAVHLYRWTGSNWVAAGRLTHPTPVFAAEFGKELAVDGDTLVVGGRTDAFVYRFDGTNWEFEQELPIPVATPQVLNVAVDGDTILVAQAQGPDVVHVFVRGSSTWTLEATLAPGPDPDEPNLVPSTFGGSDGSLHLRGDLAAVGSFGADIVGGLSNTGAIYLYSRQGSTWIQADVLLPPMQPALAQLGYGMAMTSTQLLAPSRIAEKVHVYDLTQPGFPLLDSFDYGLDLLVNQHVTLAANDEHLVVVSARFDDGGPAQAGVVSHHRRAAPGSPSPWVFEGSLPVDDAVMGDSTIRTAMSGNVLVRGKSTNTAGTAAAYVMRMPNSETTNLGGGVAGAGGFVPSLTTTTCAAVSHSFAFELTGGLGGAVGGLVISLGASPGFPSANGGLLFPMPPWVVEQFHVLDGSGAGNGTKSMELGLLPPFGMTYVGQCLYLDPAVPAGWSQSNAVELVVGAGTW